jgi:small subunit ribosomal protein S7
MSRRNAAEKRPVLPDPQFNSRLASMIVARLMKHGKKSTAQRILSDAFSLINERTGNDPLELFETAVRNATPLVEVRARRVGGATYQVPMEVRQERGTAMALRWPTRQAAPSASARRPTRWPKPTRPSPTTATER